MDTLEFSDYSLSVVNLFQATVGAFNYNSFELKWTKSFTEWEHPTNVNKANFYFSVEGTILLTLWLVFSLIILLNLLIALLSKEYEEVYANKDAVQR